MDVVIKKRTIFMSIHFVVCISLCSFIQYLLPLCSAGDVCQLVSGRNWNLTPPSQVGACFFANTLSIRDLSVRSAPLSPGSNEIKDD